jgi:serine phosphatase RsbU (regulator of sigma subunit)/anti-sigma regulatory factor (Ser/Thr protein kinase)
VKTEIDPADPLMVYLQQASGPVDLGRLRLESPALKAMLEAGTKIALPLVTQGELIGVLSLGARRSGQEYSVEDHRLLDNLANHAAPALRMAQLVGEQEAQARLRERYEQELRIAHVIQQNFLPTRAPELEGWALAGFYRSAREVGGDFYDFIELSGGRLGIVIGDVTDKGVPAALMMASTRSVLRSVALRIDNPGGVLEEANDLLCPDMPPKMFVTCLYAVLEASTGRLVYANAGHNVPYRQGDDCPCEELKARGMPLGLIPGSSYEEREVVVREGDTVLFTSDGIVEAHNSDGEMFGVPRLVELVRSHSQDDDLRKVVMDALEAFTGPGWEQEDDITMVTLQRVGVRRLYEKLRIASHPGNERQAMEQVAEAIAPLGIEPDRLEKVKTAVAEATMNAIEHGNKNDPDLDVTIDLDASDSSLRIRVTDLGGGAEIPAETSPDIDAKLRGEQSPRGWGLFLMKSMVDEVNVTSDDVHHTVELVVKLQDAPSRRPQEQDAPKRRPHEQDQP